MLRDLESGQSLLWPSQVALVVKNPLANADEETRVQSLGGEELLERKDGSPLQYSILENPMDRGAWEAVVHRVTKSQT